MLCVYAFQLKKRKTFSDYRSIASKPCIAIASKASFIVHTLASVVWFLTRIDARHALVNVDATFVDLLVPRSKSSSEHKQKLQSFHYWNPIRIIDSLISRKHGFTLLLNGINQGLFAAKLWKFSHFHKWFGCIIFCLIFRFFSVPLEIHPTLP